MCAAARAPPLPRRENLGLFPAPTQGRTGDTVLQYGCCGDGRRAVACRARTRADRPAHRRRPRASAIADGYAIQAHNVARRVAAGATVRGRKLGLTSRAHAAAAGRRRAHVRGADSTSMFVDDGAELPLTELLAPRVEAELAFVLAADLVGPGCHRRRRARRDRRRAARDRGGRQPDRRLAKPDRRHRRRQRGRGPGGARYAAHARHRGWTCDCSACCSRATAVRSTAARARPRSVTRPPRSRGWPTRSSRFGEGLRRGDVVLAGALTRMVPVRAGDRFSAEFAHLGAVSVRFAGGGPE